MRSISPWAVLGVMVTIMLAAPIAQARRAIGTAFTYQGRLKQNGVPVTGTFWLRFQLWTGLTGGLQTGSVDVPSQSVVDGLFTASLDFGATFEGTPRWLEVQVVSNGGSTVTTLSPRQPLTPIPYAQMAQTALQMPGVFVNSDKLGIGTPTPGEKLTVAGSMEIGTHAADYRHLRIGGGNSSGFLYGSYPKYGDGIHIGYNYYADEAGNDHVINPGGGTSRITMGYGAIRLAVDPIGVAPFSAVNLTSNGFAISGSVGINNLLPSFLLHCNGTAGKPGGGSWSNTSDIRLKKNIEPLEGTLDRLLGLRGVTFEYIDPKAIDELEGQRIGMIAQEVEQVFPDWVEERKDGYKAVTYRGFEALTVEALRDLRKEKDAQIEALKAENKAIRDEMETENAALRSRLNELERQMRSLLLNAGSSHH